MKIIIFKGGLGNQMFQYVFYHFLKKRGVENIAGYYGKKELGEHHGLQLTSVFHDIKLPSATLFSQLLIIWRKIIRKVNKKNLVIPRDIYSPERVVYDGYWHDEAFFDDQTPNLFKFNVELDSINTENLKTIVSNKSISVHIRRGDYLKFADIYGEICSLEYYNDAIAFFNENYKDNLFVFFSDDMNWVKENFKSLNAIYIENNNNDKSYLDMYLMSNCKHNIIANSTFSWWAAYLNKNIDKKVIMPSKWYNTEINTFNLYPSNWLKL